MIFLYNCRLFRRDVVVKKEEKVEKITATVSSLRLDAIAAQAFGTSRAKIHQDIICGKIKVNWQEITRPDFLLKIGDVLSGRGRGRVCLKNIMGKSKKGRLIINLEKKTE